MQQGTPQDLEEFNWYSDIFDEYKNKDKNN